MFLYHILLLAFIQGLTEFLPVSSSGHLIIIPHILGWPDQGLAMDVAVHVGTLLAVLLYFHKDIYAMIRGFITCCQGQHNEDGHLALKIGVATLPAVIGGAALSMMQLPFLRTCLFVGFTTLIFGILLGVVDHLKPQQENVTLTYKKSFFIGMAQALALLPGVSRSGICMTMGRYFMLKRTDAARFSFLLSIPTIIGAAVLTGYKLHAQGLPYMSQEILLAIGASFMFGLMAIHFMMTWLKKSNFIPFVVYRLILGCILIYMGLVN